MSWTRERTQEYGRSCGRLFCRTRYRCPHRWPICWRQLIHCGLILGLVAVAALVFIWMERKISGRIQDRLGPTRVGGKFGWLQTLSDGIKLIAKEDLAPRDADQMLFRVAPYVSFTASFTAFLALPFRRWLGGL